MKQLKKTILTLVALLALTTQAWADADYFYLVISGTSGTLKYGSEYTSDNPYLNIDEGCWYVGDSEEPEEWEDMGGLTAVTIDASCNNYNGTSLNSLFLGFSGLTTINGLENLNTANIQDIGYMFADCSSLTSLDLSSFNTASVTDMFSMFSGCSKLTSLDLSSWNTEKVEKTNGLFYKCSELTTVDLSSWNTAKVWNTSFMFYNCSKLENIYVGDGWSTAKVTMSDDMFTGCTKLLSMNTANPATNKTNAHTGDGGYLKVKPASSGPEVAWNKAENSGSFTMPGGNVTLEPEYYPQAALATAPTAINDVPATTDGAIVEAGTVANIGESANAQGTVMYYVSPTALGDAALLALAADQWTADVPTAAGLAQGEYHVYYYVRGNDGDTDDEIFSDGDILASNALTVKIGAEPTYAVTFADGVNPEPPAEPEWTASPAADVKKGQTVTVTYTGAKKVIGVKAEKKAAEPVADIVWDATNISDINVQGTSKSYTKEGVKLSANANNNFAMWDNYNDPTKPGIAFLPDETGGFTFTAPTGKAFTKIEISTYGTDGWASANLGSGWAFNADVVKNIFTATWTGSAATSTVELLTGAGEFYGANVKSIAFYLSE